MLEDHCLEYHRSALNPSTSTPTRRYKFVLKDHCLEYHRYLPTGLHDPKVLGTLLIADTEAREFVDTAGQGNTFEIR